MAYYAQLVREIEKCMEQHPHSTVVMDYHTRKVVASGTDTQKIAQQISRQPQGGTTIVFRRPSQTRRERA